MKVTKFDPSLNAVLGGILTTGTVSKASNAYAIGGVVVEGSAASNWHIVAYGSNYARWIPHDASGTSLDDLSDVTITAAQALDRLHYTGSSWVNTAAIWRPLMDGTGNVITDAGTGEAVMALS